MALSFAVPLKLDGVHRAQVHGALHSEAAEDAGLGGWR